jgi:hypothetical protein
MGTTSEKLAEGYQIAGLLLMAALPVIQRYAGID